MQVTWLGWAGVEIPAQGERVVIDPLADPLAVFGWLGERAHAVPLPEVVAPRPGATSITAGPFTLTALPAVDGTGDPAAERRVGRLADGWLPYSTTPEQYARGWERVREAAEHAGRPQTPVPGLYVTVALDARADAARRCLRRNVERYYRQPLEVIASIQAMYAGTPEGLRDWLEPYLAAGARHVILRVADEESEHGLQAAGEACAALTGEPRAVLR
jgi:hypothetical protein